MSTNSTASNYINKINQDYPVAGEDNDSQGFRDNFKNIKLALNFTDENLENLKLTAVSVSNTATDFNNNIIQKVVLKNHSLRIVDKTATVVNNIEINYSDGSYQKIKLATGSNTVTITNWPSSSKSGKVTLDVTADYNCTINFVSSGGSVFYYGFDGLPLNILNGNRYIFEIWNVGNDVYIKQELPSSLLNQKLSNISSTISTATSLKIGPNTYSVESTSTYATKVTNDVYHGDLALVPNKVVTVIEDRTIDSPHTPGASKIAVQSAKGIGVNAKVVSQITGNRFTVTNVDTTSSVITVTPNFNPSPTEFPSGGTITFINPEFTDQPRVLTLTSTEPQSLTGSYNDLKGQVYVNSSSLWISYNDYTGSQNWCKIQATALTQAVTDNSSETATTAWGHELLPYGSIILWYGDTSNIPTGWALCDGTNGTPDLRNKFVVGAGSTYSAGSTGGSADAVVVSHSHNGTSATAGSHNHSLTIDTAGSHAHGYFRQNQENYLTREAGGSPQIFYAYESSTTDAAGDHSHTGSSESTGDHSHTLTIDSTGDSGTGANLPPYHALCYIMKTTGQ